MSRWFTAIVVMSVLFAPRAAPAQEHSADEEKLAKQLSNPSRR